jgi:hypothetical protein
MPRSFFDEVSCPDRVICVEAYGGLINQMLKLSRFFFKFIFYFFFLKKMQFFYNKNKSVPHTNETSTAQLKTIQHRSIFLTFFT